VSDGTAVGPDSDPVDLDSMEPLTRCRGIPTDGQTRMRLVPNTAAGQRRDRTDFPSGRAIFSWRGMARSRQSSRASRPLPRDVTPSPDLSACRPPNDVSARRRVHSQRKDYPHTLRLGPEERPDGPWSGRLLDAILVTNTVCDHATAPRTNLLYSDVTSASSLSLVAGWGTSQSGAEVGASGLQFFGSAGSSSAGGHNRYAGSRGRRLLIRRWRPEPSFLR
jgi:hypothetical protein